MKRRRNSWTWARNWPVDKAVLSWGNEPNNAKGNENCAAVNEQMTFTDESCDQKYGYLCEVMQEGCPLGFLISDDRCLYVSNTLNASELMTKQQAQARCKSMGGNIQLANLENQANIDYLKTVLPENAQNTLPWWVSATKTGGQWMWDNGSPAQLTWAQEPNNLNGGERCAIFVNGKFADKACNSLFNYVCKRTDGSVPQTPYDGKFGCGSWTRAGKKCYFFQTMFGDTQDGARQRCLNVGADLLKIDSLDEQDWIDKIATYYTTTYWTQLRSSGGGPWAYADGSQPSQDVLVWNQEPNDYMGIEDCVAITAKLTWNDQPCGQNGGYICEAPSTGGCPKNWVSNNAGVCYLFGPTASNVTNTMSWGEARSLCQRLAEPLVGTLLAVDDPDELNFVNNQLSTRQSLSLFYWTGLNDRQGEGLLTYADHPENPVDNSLIPWDKSPSCSSCNPACASINAGGYFSDYSCDMKLPFVCERFATGISGSKKNSQSVGLILFVSAALVLFRTMF
ncbi:macrophage mannose receptor 1-like isoform X2 [Liolophura sinensis]